MTALKKDAMKSPVYHIVIVTLIAVGLVSLPVGEFLGSFTTDSHKTDLIGGIVVRLLLSAAAVVAIFKYGFQKQLTAPLKFKAVIAVLPALIVAVNNFPFSAVIGGNANLSTDAFNIVLYAVYCFSVGAFEELTFCGIIFPLCVRVFKDKKYCVPRAVFTAAAIFGCSHLVNLLGGAGIGPTFMQVGYSFLIGAMCYICKSVTGNIFTAVFIHSVYDAGGLLFSAVGLGAGNQWDTVTVIVTAILGVIAASYMFFIMLKIKPEQLNRQYFYDENGAV